MTLKPNFLPLMIDMNDKKIVIIGGGSVAERKSRLFLDYADVLMVNATFSTAITERTQMIADRQPLHILTLMKINLESITDNTLREIISPVFLVIAATNDHLFNSRVTKIANQCGVLSNRVDAVGEVIIPSVISKEDITIGISTQGASPAFAKFMRKKIEQLITPQYSDMLRLQSTIRSELKQTLSDQVMRKEILWEILNNDKIWQALSVSYEKALKIARKMCQQFI